MITEIVELAAASGTDPDRLVAVLRLGSGSSRALTLLGEGVTPATAGHLSAVEDADVDLFAVATPMRASRPAPSLRERQSRDRGRWEETAGCCAPGATMAMSWFDGSAAAFVERSRSVDVGGSRGVRRLSPPAVRVPGDRALAELPLVIEFRTDVDGVEADLRPSYR